VKNFEKYDNGGPHQIQVYRTELDPNDSDVHLLDFHDQPDLSLIVHKPESRIPQAKRVCHLLSSDFPESLVQGTHRAHHYDDGFCAFDSNGVEAHQKLFSRDWRTQKQATFVVKLRVMFYIHLKWHRASTDPSIQARNGQLALLVGVLPRSVVRLCVRRFAPSRSPPLSDKISLRAGCGRYLTFARFREPKIVTKTDFRRKT